MEEDPEVRAKRIDTAYANDVFRRVDFLFQRKGVERSDRKDGLGKYGELELEDIELDFIASAFEENFMDRPDTVEITLVDGTPDPVTSPDPRGVLVITQHSDGENIYSILYTIIVHSGPVHGPIISKDVHAKRIGTTEGEPEGEAIDVSDVVDELERQAILAMISRL